MKRKIVIWAIAGFLVASLWALYAAATFPSPLISAQPHVWTLIYITCPIAFASFHFHFGNSCVTPSNFKVAQCSVILHLRQ